MGRAKDFFCDKNIQPLIISIVFLGIVTAIWASVKNDEIFQRHERVDRDTMRAQLQNNPIPPPPQIQLVRNQVPIDPQNMMLNGITRATPMGGVQLVRGTMPIAFQDIFKNAIRIAKSAVVDVHATCLNRIPTNNNNANQNAPSFVNPFAGNVDRHIGQRPYENIGAGFIVAPRGYVITNYHVVENAVNIIVTVTDPNPRDFQAKIVLTDSSLDVALLKIVANEQFSVCPIGNSSQASVGDWVIAIGSPFGLDMSVTAGIISGMRKSITIDGNVYQDLIQTDTPINKGNSGGPLINLNGEVIGVTTAIYAPTGVFSGTGFAIPIDSIKKFINDGIGPDAAGFTQVALTNMPQWQVGQRTMGIEVIPVNTVIAREFRLPVTRGVVINKITDNSPAANAGLLRGDTIVMIDGVRVSTPEQIPAILQNSMHKPSISITYYRNGQEADCKVYFR